MRSLTSACSSAAFARFGLLASVTVLCGCNEAAERLYKEQLRDEYAEVLRVQPAPNLLRLLPPASVEHAEWFELTSSDITFKVPAPAATRRSAEGETLVLEYPGFEAAVLLLAPTATEELDRQLSARWGETWTGWRGGSRRVFPGGRSRPAGPYRRSC